VYLHIPVVVHKKVKGLEIAVDDLRPPAVQAEDALHAVF
jgi:hypothetical protein